MLTKIAAMLSALLETGGSPEGMLYVFFDMNLNLWYKVRNQLVQAGLIQVKSNYVTLTPAGIEIARQIDALVSARKAKQN